MDAQVGTTLRNGSLSDLVEMLRHQNDVKFDAVVPASALSYHEGQLHVAGATVLDLGVTPDGDLLDVAAPAVCDPTGLFDDQLADRLGIPTKYLRRMRGEKVRVDVSDAVGWDEKDGDPDEPDGGAPSMLLLDANVNAWLASQREKRYLIRAFHTGNAHDVGIARAILSNRFGFMDDYDVILAALSGVRDAGVDLGALHVVCDRSERNMRVRIDAPTVTASAYEIFKDYKCPYTGRKGSDYPLVNAGLALGNSETGGGAFTVADRILVQVCKNGQTRDIAVREIHVGSRLEDGVIRWSEATHKAALAVIQAKTTDAVRTFLSVEHVEEKIQEIAEHYGVELPDPQATITRVSKQHGFSDEEASAILDCFIRSGDVTAGGVMQAVTATAQRLDDPDRAAELEAEAFPALVTAAAR